MAVLRLVGSLALVFLCVVAPAGAAASHGEGHVDLAQFSESLAEPLRIISEARDHVTVEVTATAPRVRRVRLDGKAYTQLRIPGFESGGEPGSPEIPSLTARLYVPQSSRLSFRILDLAKGSLPLGRELAFAPRVEHDDAGGPARRNATAYRETHGAQPVVVEEVSYAGADRIAVVRFFPARYDARNRKLTLHRRLAVRFTFSPDSRAAADVAPVRPNGAGIARYVVLNRASLPPARRDAGPIDLLIADASYQTALARYVDFKRALGREVREHYVSGKSAEEIREIIRAEYQSERPPGDTFLVGSIAQIPSWRGSGDNTWSDFKYTALDGGSVPDISLGRVPAQSIEELEAFIDKAIAREIEPRNVDDVLLTAGRDTSLGCPANVTKVGENLEKAGDAMYIVKKYKTEVGTQDILDGYNAYPNLIVYDGHGNRQGMKEVPLMISDLDKLTTTGTPIILDIACLNANWPSSGPGTRNFAEMILLRAGSGAAGILASGGSGDGHRFFRTIGEIMADARRNLSEDPGMNEIGRVILVAKVKNGTQDRTYWNYYGDPASSVWESTPAPVSRR